MSKVYIVIGWHDNEDYNQPVLIIDSKEDAIACGYRLCEKDRFERYDYIHVMEYEVGKEYTESYELEPILPVRIWCDYEETK